MLALVRFEKVSELKKVCQVIQLIGEKLTAKEMKERFGLTTDQLERLRKDPDIYSLPRAAKDKAYGRTPNGLYNASEYVKKYRQ